MVAQGVYILLFFFLGATLVRAQCSGTLTISSSSDAGTLSSCSVYDGDVIIASGASGQISLNGVGQITGDLRAKNATQVTAISADRLSTIAGTFDLESLQILSSLQMPYLAAVNRINWTALPSLQALSFTRGVSQANQVYISNTGLTSLRGIELTAVGSVDINNNPYLSDMTLNSMRNITNAFSTSANGRNLNVALQNLVQAANITVRNASGFSIPSLVTVAGTVGLYSNYFSTFTAPNLTTIGNSLTIVNSAVSVIDVPELQTISGGLQLTNNTNLTAIKFPALTRINGDLIVYGNINSVSFERLQRIMGSATFHTTSSNTTICDLFQTAKKNQVILGTLDCKVNASPNTTSPSGTGQSGSASNGSGNSSTNDNDHQNRSHRISSGAIAGIVVGVLALLILIAALLIMRRRTRRQRTPTPAPPAPEVTERRELYAGPADPRIAGPVQPRHELLTRPNNDHELHGHTSSNAPWRQELNSSQIYEANNGITRPHFEVADRSIDPTSSNSATTTQGSSTGPLVQESIFDDSELIEEADVAVQELGLVSVRKRALNSQAQAAGSTPAEMGGRKAEEWQELLQREKKIKARLAEIQRLRGAG